VSQPAVEAKAEDLSQEVSRFGTDFRRLQAEIAKEVVGYQEIVERVLTCLFSGGHCLLEGVPGLGKTLLVRTLSQALDVSFSRVQFSPDLMPADIVGTNVLVISDEGQKTFRFEKGPIFANVVLADEINRATPKTQAALLEAMQEHAVTAGGTRYSIEEPFFVLGTQNPIDMEGTYPLPEAQVDRFLFKLHVGYLGEEELLTVIDRTTSTAKAVIEPVLSPERIHAMRHLVRQVAVAEHVKRTAVRLARATQPTNDAAPDAIKRYVKFGASPRGILSLILGGKVRALLDGRTHLACEDLRAVFKPALRHRVILNFEGEAEHKTSDELLDAVLEAVPDTATE